MLQRHTSHFLYDKVFFAKSLKNGLIPFWCPLYFCGAPFMSDIQTT